jgi:uncharacterized protein (TIGR03790 family)
MLVRAKPYPLDGWVLNPFFPGNRDRRGMVDGREVVMVSRLDGPSPECVRRVMLDSVQAEKQGLKGRAWFDARWAMPEGGRPGDGSGYGHYDASIHRAADAVRRSGVMPVTLDATERLFQKGECPEASLYCGWYSLNAYIDAFDWLPGAVGCHIASVECASLRNENGTGWCRGMLDKGAAAVVGPVGEPYVQAFPLPELFFGLLVEGRLCLAEVYLASSPFLSWKMVLVGDPLYRPFSNVRRGIVNSGG